MNIKSGRILWSLAVTLLLGPAVATMASDAGQTAAARVSEASYRHYLDDMLYTHDGDNRGFGPEHDLAQANIVDLFESFGLDVTLEPVDYQGVTYWNVVGTKLGTATPGEEWIIGAHYDSVNNPGADDNASGVALVLETARILSVYPSDDTIRFIAFDREEQGLHGAWAYVDDHIDDNILGMISADMVAYNTGANSVDIYGRTASDPIKSALATAIIEYGQGLAYSVWGQMDASDHAPFERRGFQACLLIEDWGNPYYHTQQDSVDTPDYIDYAFATRSTRVVVGFLVDQAGVDVGDCGNGVVDPGETCDVQIAAGQPGACPTSCENIDPCIIVTLMEPGTCQARCESVEITDPIHGDGCCPAGANSLNDDDCEPFCGNAVCEAGEESDCIADCTCGVDEDCNDLYVCTHDTCEDGMCVYTPGTYDYGDVTGNGIINVFDVFCVLEAVGGDYTNCSLADADIHPCSGNGAANLFDAFAVLDAIAGVDACCGGGSSMAAPTRDRPREVVEAGSQPWVSLVPSDLTIAPGEEVTVDVWVGGVPDLGAYEFTVDATGGRGGRLDLVAATIDDSRNDHVFHQVAHSTAADVEAALIAARASDGGSQMTGRSYLGTYTFRASADARGPFLLAVWPGQRSLTDAAGNNIDIRLPPTALVTVR